MKNKHDKTGLCIPESRKTESEILMEIMLEVRSKAERLNHFASQKLECVISGKSPEGDDDRLDEHWSYLFSELRSNLHVIEQCIDKTMQTIENTELPIIS